MRSVVTDLEAFADQFLGPRELPDIVDWCEQEMRLIDKDADYKGPFSTENCPDIREILRSCVSPEIETTVIVGPTQSFKTTILMGVVGYTVAVDHGPVGWVISTEPLARAFSQRRWQPTAANSDALARLVSQNADEYKTLELGYTTCTVRFAGSHSATNLASFPYKRVIGDEVDKYPQRIRNEAGTLDLLLQRTGQYTVHNHIFASTPTVATGTIWQAALRGDCRRYQVPCPHCGRFFAWQFAQLKWDQAAKSVNGQWDFERVARTAHYECPHCAGEIWENHRRDMLHAGRWEPDAIFAAAQRDDYGLIADPRSRSYLRSCFNVIHPNRTFARIAEKHLKSGKDPSKRQNFTNSELGEVFEDAGETVEWEVLSRRAEDYLADESPMVPDEMLVLTAGADVQANPPRIEYEIVGWGEDLESWGVQYGIIERRTTWAEAFAELDRVLLTPWPHPRGFTLLPAAVCIDTGHETEEVYKYVRRCQPRRVYAVKGSSEGYGHPLVSRPQKSGVKQVTLYLVGTVTAKAEIYSRLRLTEAGPGCMHFPKNPKRGYDAEWYRQLTAEKCVTKYVAGRQQVRFMKPSGRRNEALDIRCYARAAVHLLNPAFSAIRAKVTSETLAADTAQLEISLAAPTLETVVANGAPEFDLENGRIERVGATSAAEKTARPNAYEVVGAPLPQARPRVALPRPRRRPFCSTW